MASLLAGASDPTTLNVNLKVGAVDMSGGSTLPAVFKSGP